MYTKTEVPMCKGDCWALCCHREEPVYGKALRCVRLICLEPRQSPLKGSECANSCTEAAFDHLSVSAFRHISVFSQSDWNLSVFIIFKNLKLLNGCWMRLSWLLLVTKSHMFSADSHAADPAKVFLHSPYLSSTCGVPITRGANWVFGLPV